VGSHLCTRLINEGHDVICLDNYFGDKKNILHLIGNPHFEWFVTILRTILLRLTKYITWLVQLSVHYQYNPIKTIKTSVLEQLIPGLAGRVR
jgi:UDP-glucuronate decarboxylase